MQRNDERTLRQFTARLAINTRAFDSPTESKLKSARLTLAKRMLNMPQQLMDSLNRDFPIPHGYIPIDLVLNFAVGAGHAEATAQIALLELVKQQHVLGKSVEMPWQLRGFVDSKDWAFKGDLLFLVRATDSLASLLIEDDRECGARDHVWLKWHQDDGLGPAAIRDRWNEMSDAERRECSPRCFAPIASKERGRAVVKTALSKASAELVRAASLGS